MYTDIFQIQIQVNGLGNRRNFLKRGGDVSLFLFFTCMETHMLHNPVTIWSISTPVDDVEVDAKDSYTKILPYITDFLCSKHPFRKGIMCPFVPSALKNDNIYFSYTCETNVENCVDIVKHLTEKYVTMREKEKGKYISFVLMFPEDYDVGKVLDIHYLSKVFCIEDSIMIGALYSFNNAPSLHNNEYFPLRTQVPCLVLRDLTSQDLLFLEPEQYSTERRIEFLKTFVRDFESSNSNHDKEQVEKAKMAIYQYSDNKNDIKE